MRSVYGNDGSGADWTSALLAKLNSFVTRADVAGLVVPVDADASTVAAYNAWNGSPCSASAANGVVDAVNAVVRRYKNLPAISGGAPNLTSVVLVGSDQQLPMRRITDLTWSANENGYAESDSTDSSHDNPLSAAQKQGDLLSDDAYGSLTPLSWADRRLYLPDLAVGRLVETPEEIQGQLDQFTGAGGALTPSTALTTGYDFLADGTHAVDSALAHDVTGARSALIDDLGSTSPWTKAALLAKLFPSTGGSPYLDSINAHFDHNRALTSAGNATTSSDLLTVTDITAHTPPASPPDPTAGLRGRVLFSMGCHAGLNVPEGYVGPGSLGHDWAQTFAAEKAIWVANTGYGLGDTASVALSEEVMRQFAQRLDGSMTAGEALQYAKHAYFGLLGAYGVYDEKAMEEAVYYGLPMWRVGGQAYTPGTSTSVPAPAVTPTPPADPAAAHATTLNTTDSCFSGLTAADITVSPTFTQSTAPGGRGTLWSVGGEVQDTHYRPIQPRTSVGLAGSTPAAGSRITDLSTQDFTGVDPVFGRPTVDLSAHEPEASAPDSTFPSQFETLTSFSTPTGPVQRLVMIPGQFFSSRRSTLGTQRLFTSMTSRVLFSTSSNYTPPTMTNAVSALSGSGVSFSVDATAHAPDTVARVVVLFHTAGASSWQRLNLTHGSGSTWSGVAGNISEAVEWFAQAEDTAGNVGITDDKGLLFGSQAGFKATVLGPVGANGWFTGPPTVDADGPAASYRVIVDGVDRGPVPQQMAAGSHAVVVTGSDNSTHSLGTIKVDSLPPTARFISPSPPAFKLGASGDYVIECTDLLSGVVDCPGPGTVNTSNAGGGVLSFTIHDGAGNAASISLPYTVQTDFVGFTQPVNDPWTPTTGSVFKYGSTIPLKFQLKNGAGALISDALAQTIANQCAAKLSFVKTGTNALPVDETAYTDASDSGGCFRYDLTARQFIYNLGTKALPNAAAGQQWSLRALITLNGGTMADHAVLVGLK